jgi:hypothetical protein
MQGDAAMREQTQTARIGFRPWELLTCGLLVSLLIVGPTFLSEETWHGAPLIDRGGISWLVPAL